jgi:prophage antirepressor-like protein
VTQIQPFTFPTTGQPVRTLLVDGEPWFVAADVCTVLGHSDTTKAMAMVDDEDRQLYRRSEAPNFAEVFPDQRVKSVNLVNESGLYSLILRSNVPGAKVFKRWVTREVLPSLRRTGAYSVVPTPVRIELTINALAELAHNEHVVPMAGRILAFKRWNKPRKGIEAFVQLQIDAKLPGIDGGPANTKVLPQ